MKLRALLPLLLLLPVPSAGQQPVNSYVLRDIPAQERLVPTDPVPTGGAAFEVGEKWYGADSRRARMQFTTHVLYGVPDNYYGAVSQILSDGTQYQAISELIDLQLQHMYGAFTTHPGFVDNPGIPSGDYKVQLLSAEKVPNQPYAKVTYSYDDYAVFSSRIFPGGSSPQRIQFVLPRDPVAVYGRGFPSPSSRVNRCTDSHYNSEGDFWYFWNPYQDGCPLTGADLVGVTSDLQPLPVTRGTYPDYSRLYGSNGSGDELRVTYLVGVDENFSYGDLGKQTFRDAAAGLRQAGFKLTVDESRRKRFTLQAGGKRVSIDMHLVDPNTTDFSVKAVHGMRTADIFLYDGHSGLGGYLDPERLRDDTGRKLTLPVDKYQVFYFNGCSTYAYYTTKFFNLKKSGADPKGTRNLDIITTGIGADFGAGALVDVTFLAGIATGQRPSWQTLIDRIHSAEGDMSALTHVNGDEDNPRNP
jgi:hypothetical protein